MPNIQIHYDCDPGQDDAIALLYALGAGVDIASLSIVGGNVDVNKCTRNALQILEFTDRADIPVYKGAAQPLKRLPQPLPHVFGECGMAGANLPDPKIKPQAIGADQFFKAYNGPSTIVATGPLTNIALAILENSDLENKIEDLYIMGGCIYPEHIHRRMGNIKVKGTNEWAEYNFAIDPEAAKIVFESQIKNIFLIPMNVTRTILYRQRIDDALRQLNTKVAKLAADIFATVGEEDHVDYASEKTDKDDPVRAMHDVIAMAYLINPEIFETESLRIKIETDEPPSAAGQSLIDPDGRTVEVIKDLDRDKFIDCLITYLGRL